MAVPNVSRKQKTATRRALVTAAAELIDTQGLEACTVAAVARATAVTSGAVYSNFPSLLHLQVEAMSELRTRWVPVFDDDLPLPDAVRGFIEEYVAVWRNPAAQPMLVADVVLFARGLEDEDLRGLARQGIEATTARLGTQLERAAANGGMQLALPAREAALAFQGIVSGMGNVAGVDPSLIGVDLVIDTVMAVLVGRTHTGS